MNDADFKRMCAMLEIIAQEAYRRGYADSEKAMAPNVAQFKMTPEARLTLKTNLEKMKRGQRI